MNNNLSPEMINLLKEEMIRLHEILKRDSERVTKEQTWAMEQLTRIHEGLLTTLPVYEVSGEQKMTLDQYEREFEKP